MNFDEYIKTTGISFNNQQLQAIKKVDGATLILAVPGSGKTATIIARIGYMIHVLGIPAESILTITYTRAATHSMKRRYEEMFGTATVPEFRTIHGICAKILNYFERTTGRSIFKLMENEGTTFSIMRSIFTDTTKTAPTEAELNELSIKVTYHRNMQSDEETVRRENISYINFGDFFYAYRDYKLQHKIMDHDDQLEYAYTVLCTHKSILEHFRKAYRYINVDEAQDTSRLQHMIIRKLTDENIFMVGDEDQSIYGFRAAYPEALLDFEKLYENATVLLMETNYRCSGKIVDFSDKFIRHNAFRRDKSPVSSKPDGTAPSLVTLHDFASVVPYLTSLAKKTETETAVLYRNNENALPLIDSFFRQGISFNISGGDHGFFTSRTVTNLMNMLRFVMNPHDEELFLQVYYLFKVGMSRDNAERAVLLHRENSSKTILEIASTHELTQYRFITRLKLLPEQIRTCAGLTTSKALLYCASHLMRSSTFFARDASDSHKLNVLLTLSENYPDKDGFIKRLAELESEIKSYKPDAGSHITLSTIHSAKGLEYDRVVLMDVKSGTLPAKSPDTLDGADDMRTFEEDRRLFYVAITRAKRELIIFTSDNENHMPCEQSVFIDESFHPEKRIRAIPMQSTESKKSIAAITMPKIVPDIPQAEQQEIRNSLKCGALFEHRVFGRCRLISKTDSVMRILILSDRSTKAIDIDTAVRGGLVRPVSE